MQPTRPPMPELNLLGNDTVTTPGLRHGDGLTLRILLGELSHIRFQLLPAGGPALMGDGGAELATPGAGGEVVAGLLGGDFLGAAVDDQLAVEGAPEHDEGDVGVGGDVVAFAAVVVGEEDEAAVLDAFEQDHAAGGAAVGGDGGEGHGVGQGEVGVDGFVDPAAGLLDRVRQQVGVGEAGGVVFLAYVFHGGPCWFVRGVGDCSGNGGGFWLFGVKGGYVPGGGSIGRGVNDQRRRVGAGFVILGACHSIPSRSISSGRI